MGFNKPNNFLRGFIIVTLMFMVGLYNIKAQTTTTTSTIGNTTLSGQIVGSTGGFLLTKSGDILTTKADEKLQYKSAVVADIGVSNDLIQELLTGVIKYKYDEKIINNFTYWYDRRRSLFAN